jgi:hypothetical protein
MSIANLFGTSSDSNEPEEEVEAVVDQSQEAEEPDQTDQVEEVVEEPAEPVVTETQSEPAKSTKREDKGHFAPINVLLDERERRQTAERELQEYKRREREAQQRQQAPDPGEDPYAFAQYQQAMFQEQMRAQALDTSYRFALQQEGKELVDKATAWAYEKGMADPAFDFAFTQQHDPVAWVVAQYKQNELLNQVQTDPDAYVRRRAMELGLIPNPEAVQQASGAPLNTGVTQPTKKLPSGSIASAPSAAKATTPATDSPIGRMFNNK